MEIKFKVLCVAAFFALFISCDDREKVEYFPNGKIKIEAQLKDSNYHGYYKEYYKDGKQKTIMTYRDGLKQDTSFHFYEPDYKYSKSEILWENDTAYYQKNYDKSGNLISEGDLAEYNFKIGKWKFYDSNGSLKEIQEFSNIDNSTYLNQKWLFNKERDTIGGGNYFELKKTYVGENNETLRLHFNLKQPLISIDSELFVCIPKSKDLKADFSNESNIEWDTISNIAKRFRNQNRYTDRKFDVIFDIDKNENESLRGFLLEKSIDKIDSLDFVTRKIYFDIPL